MRHDLGQMNVRCPFCGAAHWLAEKIGSSPEDSPEFSTCCQRGHVLISPLSPPPDLLLNLFESNEDDGKEFRANIRQYNMALAFTSLGVTEDKNVNRRGGWVFSVQGELCHLIGSLHPDEHFTLHRVNTTTSHITYCAREVLMRRSGRDPILVAIMLQHLCVCRNLFLYDARLHMAGLSSAAVPRSARRWARSAHLHEVRHARHHHHHHHHNHNNHHGVKVSADSTGAGENESADVFTAAPSRGSHPTQSAPVAGYFGTDDALVRMCMPTRTQLGELGGGEEGGAGPDIWVHTDTDADVDTSRTGTDADVDDCSLRSLSYLPARSTGQPLVLSEIGIPQTEFILDYSQWPLLFLEP